MFNNRSFLVKMVKDDITPVASEPIDYHEVARTITKNVISVVVAYVGADTVRRAVIYALSAKL